MALNKKSMQFWSLLKLKVIVNFHWSFFMKTKYLSLTVSLMFFPYAHGVQGCGIHSPKVMLKILKKIMFVPLEK